MDQLMCASLSHMLKVSEAYDSILERHFEKIRDNTSNFPKVPDFSNGPITCMRITHLHSIIIRISKKIMYVVELSMYFRGLHPC